MRGGDFATTAKKGPKPMLKTEQTPRPIALGSPLLTAWRQVETIFFWATIRPEPFRGWSSGKSRIKGVSPGQVPSGEPTPDQAGFLRVGQVIRNRTEKSRWTREL